MGIMVNKCCERWHQNKCRLSDEIKGWGCRLLTCLPDEIPVSLHDKAMLFTKVYSYAENSGVTTCPHFRETDIDEALENDKMLKQMVLLNQPLRADLLSEFFEELYN